LIFALRSLSFLYTLTRSHSLTTSNRSIAKQDLYLLNRR
jgi:hypothetical protein